MAGAIREQEAVRGPDEARSLVLAVLQEHAESLLRVARRHSLCADDAQDAYQRAVEIFLRHAPGLRADDAHRWIHTVCKHEALRLRAQRTRYVGAEEVDFDRHEASHLAGADERVESFDLLTRSAEALQAMKPAEVRALWLRAQGHSYAEIAQLEGWSYTKVNRCVTEGRRTFLDRVADIASGAECRRWEPVLSALVDGEASAKDLAGVRPHLKHCPACRAHVRALREATERVAALLPIPLVAEAAPDHGGLLARVYEAAAGVQERVAVSAAKLQLGVEASLSAKVAVAAAGAAMIGGGGVALERAIDAPAKPSRAVAAGARSVAPARPLTPPNVRNRGLQPPETYARPSEATSNPAPTRRERVRRTTRSEFGVGGTRAQTASAETASEEFSQEAASAPSASTATAAPAPITAPPSASRSVRTAAAEFGG